MQSLLLWLSPDGDGQVLQVSGDGAATCFGCYGALFEDWPEDLGVYDASNGLHIWEGEITESKNGDAFQGKLRPLTEKEWAALRLGKDIFE